MKKFHDDFMLGAATAAHQVEGNNIHSDYWVMEHMEDSSFDEPSLEAVDHYNRFAEDIQLMAKAGLDTYRFGIEWARIEPVEGKYSKEEIAHYRNVLNCCRQNNITPIVTMHHFSSPKWLVAQGGWESEATVGHFARYCEYVAEQLGELMEYVCTINEANMGLQIASIAKDFMRQMGLQVGASPDVLGPMKAKMEQKAKAFGVDDPNLVQDFLSMRTPEGDRVIMQVHEAARDAMKAKCPHFKIGLTLSLHDMQAKPGGEKFAAEEWDEEFLHYLPYMQKDDFIGVQNYTRKLYDETGALPAPAGAELTEMDYEFYPESIGNVVRKVWDSVSIPIIVTENGIATQDDTRRVAYINRAIASLQACLADGIPVLGYTHWSLLDNFEWQRGFSKHFGLIAVDRTTQARSPKPSLAVLGSYK